MSKATQNTAVPLVRAESGSKHRFNNIFKRSRKSIQATAPDTPLSATTIVFHDSNHQESPLSSPSGANFLPATSSETKKDSNLHDPITKGSFGFKNEDNQESSIENETISSSGKESTPTNNADPSKAVELIPTLLDIRRRLITDLNINSELYQKKVDSFVESRNDTQSKDLAYTGSSGSGTAGNIYSETEMQRGSSLASEGPNSGNMISSVNKHNSVDASAFAHGNNGNGYHKFDISARSRERAERVKTALEIYFGSIERYCSAIHVEEAYDGTLVAQHEGVEGIYNPLQIIRNRRIRKKNREKFQELAFNVVPLPSQVFSKYDRQRNIWQVNLRELRNDFLWRENHWNELRKSNGKLWFPKTQDAYFTKIDKEKVDGMEGNMMNPIDVDSHVESNEVQQPGMHEQLFAGFDSESIYAKYEDDYESNPNGIVRYNGNGGSNSLKSTENGYPKTSHSSLSLLRNEQYALRTSLTSMNAPSSKKSGNTSLSSVSKLKRISKSPSRLLSSLKSTDNLLFNKSDSDLLGSSRTNTHTSSSTDDDLYTRHSSLVVPGTSEHPGIVVDELVPYYESTASHQGNTETVSGKAVTPANGLSSLESAVNKINFERRPRSRNRNVSGDFDDPDADRNQLLIANESSVSVTPYTNTDASYSRSEAGGNVISEEEADEMELLEHMRLLRELEGDVLIGELTISAHEKNVEKMIAKNNELIQVEAEKFYKKIEEADTLIKEIQTKFNYFDKTIERTVEISNSQESKIDELLGFSDRTIGEINTSVTLQIRNLNEQLESSSKLQGLADDVVSRYFYSFLETFIVVCLWIVWVIVEILRFFRLGFRLIYVIIRWVFL